MPKVTGLSAEEVQKLDTVLTSLVHGGLDRFEGKVDSKAERVAFKAVSMGIRMAEHLSPERRLGTLVEGSNKLLPKLTKYFNTEAVLELMDFVPEKFRTKEIADGALEIAGLCEKAGAQPLADLLREAVEASAEAATEAPAVRQAASAPVVSEVARAVSAAPVVSPADLTIAPAPKI